MGSVKSGETDMSLSRWILGVIFGSLSSAVMASSVEVHTIDKEKCEISVQITGEDFLPEYTKAVEQFLRDRCERPNDPENFMKILEALNTGTEEVLAVLGEEADEDGLEMLQKEVQVPAYEFLSGDWFNPAEFNVPSFGGVRVVEEAIVIPEGAKDFVLAQNEAECSETIRTKTEGELEDDFGKSACNQLFDQYQQLYSKMQGDLATPGLEALNRYLSKTLDDWASFRKEIKPQTPWELAINRWVFIDDYNKYFKSPPSWQWVVLHPSIAFDIVPEAEDGDQQTEAFVIEAVGAHWWGVDKWYLPSGIAAVAVFADRATQPDWRPGLAAYFDETFTLGVTLKGGDHGVFLSVDLVELVQDRENLLNSLGLDKVHEKLSN